MASTSHDASKTRVPEPLVYDLRRSPWSAVLTVERDRTGLLLVLVAFGLRHPDAVGSSQPNVYERAHRRLAGDPVTRGERTAVARKTACSRSSKRTVSRPRRDALLAVLARSVLSRASRRHKPWTS